MRAKLVNEALDFKRGDDPNKALDVGIDRLGGPVTDDMIKGMLKDISQDYQFDKNHPDYHGFLNMNIEDMPPRKQEYMYVYLNRWADFEEYMDTELGIYLQSATPDGDEIIFADLL